MASSTNMTDNSTVRAARWIAGGAVVFSLILASPNLVRELRPAPAQQSPTLVFVRTEDGRYTDKYCIVGSDGAIHSCNALDGLILYKDGEKPFSTSRG
ncbi:hypothetical protein [Tsukamurella paurometabola]|uniref:Uncharacterized protein n=1 Tax=Tsukamurella paurometabola TaxID=2061 RepID=A0ABS5NF31_TSUPA|nr:hypothetical protein [Tsukamurella paurometabola]MBS4102905.1 hypothetical protein [Tsukamurella paurometabola]